MLELLDFTLPDGGFGGPVALWLACHQRLEGVCGLLRRFGAHVADFGADETSRIGAEGLRRYFNVAARRHEDDENVDLFPRTLERLSGRRRATVWSLMDRLQDDHVAAARLWQPLDEQLAAIQRGERVRPDARAIDALVERFLAHRTSEEETLLAIVPTALQPDDLPEIGEAMAARRGLTWKQLNGHRH